MKAREKLATREKGILERKFVKKVLQEEGGNLLDAHRQAINKRLNRHTGNTLGALRMQVSSTTNSAGQLEMQHLKRQRFLDMKTRQSPKGKTIKSNKRIHNAIIFGHLNNVIRQLSFGFTEAVREKLKRDLTIPADG